MAGALGVAVGLGVVAASSADWDLPLLAALSGLAVASDLWAIDTTANPTAQHRILMSGSFVALVLAMVLLGATPAMLIGLTTIVVGHLRFGERRDMFLNNLVAYGWFPLLGGLAFSGARDALGVDSNTSALFYALVVATFVVALAVNFLVIAAYNSHLDGIPVHEKARRALIPILHWNLATAILAAAMAYAYLRVGAGVIVLIGVVLLSEQGLLSKVYAAEQRAEQLRERMDELASLHAGLLNTIIRSLDLRDRMTARHSAAVAHYAREIAAAIGMSEDEQHVVHTAALLHDIGKFNLPDPILKADVPLDEADWALIRRHPEEGARLVSYLDGYEQAAALVRSHHERFDGAGYPDGLGGTEIPLGARIIGVADAYDVMTARDSYRMPISSDAALAELRRVAGTQLDPAIVSVFAELVGASELRYRHAEDADFDAELALGAPAA
jgi:putative nucleotidyltransferase with HDIG domain